MSEVAQPIHENFVNKELSGPREIKPHMEGGISVGFFGKAELEEGAGKLVRFLATFGSWWQPFKLTDLIHFYQSQGWDPNVALFGLVGMWYDDGPNWPQGLYRESHYLLAFDDSGYIRVTDLFVKKCMSPRP